MSKKVQYKEEAIPLVAYDPESKKYVINDEAIDFIRTVPGPIGVVGVAGMYRTGKSYLLNQMLLNRSDGFGVGPTVNPCTKGLWVWGKPLLGQTAEGETIHILVVDSEGIGALDEDSAHDSRVFALTILLSSCFIYNSVGSIDENAIQNLSLMVNLTKNIHVNANVSEETDFEDYSQHFPSFFWVVRDFSLQLVDNDGESISQREYLDKALNIQKGFSDQIEQKNRIRRLLSTFFKDRDCYTLVRPLTNEENLQNLDKMEFDQLRPEFFEQVINLRKRILSKMKPKQLKGKTLNGEMYADVIKSYVCSINEGAVPNIESAWTYICQNECQKASANAIETYDQTIRDVLHSKLPMPLEELKVFHKMAKENAFQIFKKKSVGDDISDQYIKELTQKIKLRFQRIKNENEKESNRVGSGFIQNEFQHIERKLKMNEYKSFQEYEQDLKLFYNFFMENGPKTVNKEKIIIEFLFRATSDGSNYFLRGQNHENKLQKTVVEDLQKKLENNQSETREVHSRMEQNYKQKIYQLEMDKAQKEMQEQEMKNSVQELQQEKLKLEGELYDKMKNSESDYQNLINDLKQKQIILEEENKEFMRKITLVQSENEKERALQEQKIKYFENALEDQSKKDKDQLNEFKDQKQNHKETVKDIQNQYEKVNKQISAQLAEQKEKISEIENLLIQKDQNLEVQNKKFEQVELKLQSLIKEQNEQIENLCQENKELAVNQEQHQQNLQEHHDKHLDHVKNKVCEMEDHIKNKEEEINMTKTNHQKEKALLSQKMEFLDLQHQESKQQLEENKRSHEAILKAFETTNVVGNQIDNKQLQQIKENHTKEVRELKNQFEISKSRLLSQITQITERNNELELKLKFEVADFQKEILNLQEETDSQQETIEKQNEQLRNVENSKSSVYKDVEEMYQKKIKQLENEVEESKQKSMKEVKDAQTKSEEAIAQLKNVYEMQRESLERRFAEEKDKWEKNYLRVTEENEQKIREDQNNYEEEIENLKEDLREQESNYNSVVSQYEHELALKTQTIETLEKYISETKESMLNLQNNSNDTLQQYINNFNNERKNFIQKVEELQTNVSKIEKENMALCHKKEFLEISVQKKDELCQKLKSELDDEKKDLNEKMEEIKNKYQKSSDQVLEQKIEFSRDLALSNQRNEFLTKKNEDLQKQFENITTRYEEKLKLLKQELTQETNDKLERVEEEKDQIEQKYNKAKKTLKEIEAIYNKQLTQLEREKAICQEKLNNIECKKAEQDLKYQQENQGLVQSHQQIRDSHTSEKRTLIQNNDQLKAINLQLEQDKNELITNYERDKALWEGKFTFLEQQKEQAKSDLVDALKKFEQTLMHVQKARNNEKDEHESNLNELLISMEKKYQNQISELNETHQRVSQDFEDRLRRKDKEIKHMKDRMFLDQQGKTGQQLLTEKKLSDFIENEKRLTHEIEQLRQERDTKALLQSQFVSQEKSNLVQKIDDIEQKYKEAESKRSHMIFEHEKERAKWNLDRDHLLAQKNEQLDNIEKLEKKKELLLRENEKLRNEQRVTRRSINLYNLNSNVALNKQGQIIKKSQSPMHAPLGKKGSISYTQLEKIDPSQLIDSRGDKSQMVGFGNDLTNIYGINPYDPNKTLSTCSKSPDHSTEESEINRYQMNTKTPTSTDRAERLNQYMKLTSDNSNYNINQMPTYNSTNSQHSENI